MKLNALVMSRNPGSLKTLIAAFAELGVEYRISGSASETVEILQTEHHAALVLDFDLPQASQVAKLARMAPPKRRPVLFGMIGAGTSIAEVFEAGSNFVLYKPLDLLQVLHSFRAAEAFMQPDRRGPSRRKSETLAYLELPGGIIPALVQDLTSDGLSIQAAEALIPLRDVSVRFLLPGTTQVIHAVGDFVWADKQGRAGLYFTDVAAACRRDLNAWLRKHNVRGADSRTIMPARKLARAAAVAH